MQTAAGEHEPLPALWIRADGGPQIGYGHWVRTARLGARLSRWAKVAYIVQDEEFGNPFLLTLADGASVWTQSQAAQILRFLRPHCLLTDLQRIDDATRGFLFKCREAGVLTASIHDLGLGLFDSQMAVDPSIVTLERFLPERYPLGLHQGPRYAVLADSFEAFRELPREYSGPAQSLLISLGGGTCWHIVERFLPSLERLAGELRVVVLAGLSEDNLKWFDTHSTSRLEYQVLPPKEDPARLLFETDMVLVAGGVTLYEAACVGTPALILSHNPLQQVTAAAFDIMGIAQNLGLADSVTASRLENAVRALARNPQRRSEMGRHGRDLVDGRGAERVEELLAHLCRQSYPTLHEEQAVRT